MKAKTKLAYLIIIIAVAIAGCRKDDYQEIVVPCVGVDSVTPEDGATGIPLNQVITVTFNDEMNPNFACDPEAYFILMNGQDQVKGSVTINGKTVSFTPADELLPGTTYKVKVTTKFRNMSGLSLPKNFEWSFTTVDERKENKE